MLPSVQSLFSGSSLLHAISEQTHCYLRRWERWPRLSRWGMSQDIYFFSTCCWWSNRHVESWEDGAEAQGFQNRGEKKQVPLRKMCLEKGETIMAESAEAWEGAHQTITSSPPLANGFVWLLKQSSSLQTSNAHGWWAVALTIRQQMLFSGNHGREGIPCLQRPSICKLYCFFTSAFTWGPKQPKGQRRNWESIQGTNNTMEWRTCIKCWSVLQTELIPLSSSHAL